MIRRLTLLCLLILIALVSVAGSAQARRMVISGPGGTNQMAMMLLLQSPQADVLGITMVTGDAWEPEAVQHTLRMLELIHSDDVPLVRSQQEWRLNGSCMAAMPGMARGVMLAIRPAGRPTTVRM
jgi:hypothetical protein